MGANAFTVSLFMRHREAQVLVPLKVQSSFRRKFGFMIGPVGWFLQHHDKA
jgi:hypothetical protein